LYIVYPPGYASDRLVGSATEMVYTMSIAFRPKSRPRSARELSIGYLDDLLIVSFSLNDASGYLLETEVQEVFQNHQLCEDVLHEQKT